MCPLRNFYLGGVRRKHPQWNLQSPSTQIQDRGCTVSSLWSSDDLKGEVVKWVERIEDPNARGFCAQGTVGAGGIIPTYTAWSPEAGCPQTEPTG